MTRFQILLDKYVAGSLVEDELHELLSLLKDNQSVLREKLLSDLKAHAFDGLLSAEGSARILSKINERKTAGVSITARVIPFYLRAVAAASILFFFAMGTYLFFIKKPARQPVTAHRKTHNHVIVPGGNHAMLTFSNGSTIVLDHASTGNLMQDGNTKIVKLDSGRLAYYKEEANNKALLFNTITTPRGGQYQVQLPDGTQVWLNAASSLKFPTTFMGDHREVELKGEAYFEVTKNKVMPFVVSVGQTKVTVLGTHFNINAYSDEQSINTTLLEGSVKFNAGVQQQLLHPGQQSLFNTSTTVLTLKPVDVKQAIAWKNGFFEFDNTDLASIMRQLSRWYNVEVSYKTIDNKNLFGGGISRKINLSEVLRLLETNGVHFKIESNKITVL